MNGFQPAGLPFIAEPAAGEFFLKVLAEIVIEQREPVLHAGASDIARIIARIIARVNARFIARVMIEISNQPCFQIGMAQQRREVREALFAQVIGGR